MRGLSVRLAVVNSILPCSPAVVDQIKDSFSSITFTRQNNERIQTGCNYGYPGKDNLVEGYLAVKDPPNQNDAGDRDEIRDVDEENCNTASHVLRVLLSWVLPKGRNKYKFLQSYRFKTLHLIEKTKCLGFKNHKCQIIRKCMIIRGKLCKKPNLVEK